METPNLPYGRGMRAEDERIGRLLNALVGALAQSHPPWAAHQGDRDLSSGSRGRILPGAPGHRAWHSGPAWWWRRRHSQPGGCLTGTAGTTERSRANRILIARICGKAKQHAKWSELRVLRRPARPPGSPAAPPSCDSPEGSAPGLPLVCRGRRTRGVRAAARAVTPAFPLCRRRSPRNLPSIPRAEKGGSSEGRARLRRWAAGGRWAAALPGPPLSRGSMDP
jgi:hypothetical protein